jgi:3-oxoacyl-[acyl-carrier protein] reductase
MDLKLKDLRALVTGASRGLGYATALALAREGARVAINSHNEQNIRKAAGQIAQETGLEVFPIAGDLSSAGIPDQIVHQAAEQLGGLDILVTNHGGPPSGKFEDFDDAAWHQAVDQSLFTHVRLIRSALPYLRQSTAPSVLAVTSYSVKQPIPNLVLSNSIRSAVIGLIKTLALELGSQGIRFNSILPAWTETERVYDLMSYRAQQNGTTVEEEIKKQSASSPFGRMGTPEEFANAAAFLSSPAASYITGVMLTVDGGMYKGTL